MFLDSRSVALLAIVLLPVAVTRVIAQEQRPLTEDEVVQLVDQFKDKAIIGRLEKEIAEHGRGKFFAANTAGELNKSLGELVAKAAPPPVTAKAQRRAIHVMEPKVSRPALAKLCVTKANGIPPGQNFYTAIAEYPEYGEIRLPSADKCNVWFVPKEGMPIRMLKEFSIKDRVIVDVKPEEYLGIVQVTSDKSPELMVVSAVNGPAPGQNFEHRSQHTKKLGESMLVPAGKYDVWIVVAKKAIKVESELEVPAGKITKVE